ncbi:RxLR effector family protein [Phytophthora palmivora]|uniref:RxLR effector family protein n=1 Tax=Phytophthora palmivora TaxID=4796 RepID=A0A2P4YFC4_9STRA|nr:RxLR effector family protein [Phytophthora palmivora]
MRVLSLVSLISLVSAASGFATSETTGITQVKLDPERWTHDLAGTHKQVKRSLRQYDFTKLSESTSNHEERGFVDKIDDVVTKMDDVIGKATIPTNLNAAVEKAVEKATMTAYDLAAVAKTIAAKYPKDLSAEAMKQIQKIEELRLKDVVTYSKETVGRGKQRYEHDKRLLSSAVISRPVNEGGGDVLFISSSKKKYGWILPKGGWDEGEKIEMAALREVIEEGGVNAKLLHNIGDFSDEGHKYYAYMMRSDTVYDDWAESVRYRLWVSYEDAIKLLGERTEMVNIVKKAQEADELIKKGKLKPADPELENIALPM